MRNGTYQFKEKNWHTSDSGLFGIPTDGLPTLQVGTPLGVLVFVDDGQDHELQVLLIGLLGHEGVDLVLLRHRLAAGGRAGDLGDLCVVDERGEMLLHALAAVVMAAARQQAAHLLGRVGLEADGALDGPRWVA